MNKISLKPVLKALFAVLVWGGSFVATKVALNDVSPVTVIWLRFGLGFIILGIGVIYRKQFAFPSQQDLFYFALLGFIGITFHQWLQSTGLTTAQATTTAWIVATTPIFMALLGLMVLKEKLSFLQVLGILTATFGVLMVVSKGDFTALFNGKAGTFGDILILISSPNWAIFSTLSRRGLKTHPAARMMFYVMGWGFLFTTIQFLFGPGFSDIHHLTQAGWISIGFLGILCSGIAYIFWYDALQVMPVAQTGAFVYIEPFVTVIVAAVVLNEPLLLSSLFGGGIIILGVWLVNRKKNV
jgi:drug/metabolite transporter (DMT)-like permease